MPANHESHVFTKFIGELEVKPLAQPSLSLGWFTRTRPAKGFCIQLDPEPDFTESVVTQITKLGTDDDYRFILHVANYGDKTICAKVWAKEDVG